MSTGNRICLLIPYYGKWPPYFDLFLASCKYQQLLDVYLITDIDSEKVNKPSNVEFVYLPLTELVQRMNSKLGLQRDVVAPRKICDFKPAYGLLFNELTVNYDFWAYGDIDLVFGDLSRYLKPEILNSHDILTFREEWIHGPFTIFRNTDYTKTLFRESTDWFKVFSTDEIYCFDECGKKHGLLRKGVDPLDIQVPFTTNDVHDMTQVVRKQEQDGKIRVYRRYYAKESLPFDEIIWFDHGKILGAGYAEYIFYHFVWDKTQRQFTYPNWNKIPDKYFISTTGFYKNGDALWRVKHYFRKYVKGPTLKLRQRAIDSFNYRLKSYLVK